MGIASSLITKFNSKVALYGFTVVRTRPEERNSDGTVKVPSSMKTYLAIKSQERIIKIETIDMVGGQNNADPGHTELLFPATTDIQAGDKLVFAGYRWNVTHGADPQLISDAVVYWTVQAVREAPA